MDVQRHATGIAFPDEQAIDLAEEPVDPADTLFVVTGRPCDTVVVHLAAVQVQVHAFLENRGRHQCVGIEGLLKPMIRLLPVAGLATGMSRGLDRVVNAPSLDPVARSTSTILSQSCSKVVSAAMK